MSGTTLDISEARRQFSSIDKRLKDDRVIFVTRHNKKAFAVVDLEYLSAVLETLEILSDPEAMQMLQQSIQDIRAGRLYDHADVEKELG
jgi:PHD/YefM family antitoxin component YafN of YafNO toxin-antitoxin module